MFNYGLRYEINGKITDKQNRLSSIEENRFVIASDDKGQISPLANDLFGLIPVPYIRRKQPDIIGLYSCQTIITSLPV